MRLERHNGDIRLLTVRSKRDVTALLTNLARSRVEDLAGQQLDGYVLKKDSPSCGLSRVKVYGESGAGDRTGRGLFAQRLTSALPLLPAEEEGRLHDPRIRENFIVRVFAHQRLRALLASDPRAVDLMTFHARHKLLVLSHSPSTYGSLGQLVAGSTGRVPQRRLEAYGALLMRGLSMMATPGRHANVLQHMAGHFSRTVEAASRRELADSIGDYQRGLVPLVVPITLILHHARMQGVQYLLEQVYLQPHPKELMLRNHV